jgi:hypothetical protein
LWYETQEHRVYIFTFRRGCVDEIVVAATESACIERLEVPEVHVALPLSRDKHFNDVAVSIHGHHMQAYGFSADIRTEDCRDHALRTGIDIIHIPPSCAIGACGDRGHPIHSVLVIILLGDVDTGDRKITGPGVGPCLVTRKSYRDNSQTFNEGMREGIRAIWTPTSAVVRSP